jgi:hypothetical protein
MEQPFVSSQTGIAMRLTFAALTAIAFLPTATFAITAGPPTVPYVDVALGSGNIRLLLPAADNDGKFGGRAFVVQCDGSVREATACGANEQLDASVSLSVEGSIFPEISGSITFVDAGSATSLIASFGVLIPSIPGAASTILEGSVTVPANRSGTAVTSALPSGQFIEGGATGPGGTAYPANLGLVSIVPDPLDPKTVSGGPVAGTFDCATIGGCELMVLAMAVNGQGGGAQYLLSGRFDLDAATPTPVPLPAPLALLAAGLALLGVAARRR